MKFLNKVKRGKDNPNAKSIVAVDPATNELKREYGAISEAARDIVGTDDFIINQRARNSITTAKKSKRPWKGFIWYERKEWKELNGEKD